MPTDLLRGLGPNPRYGIRTTQVPGANSSRNWFALALERVWIVSLSGGGGGGALVARLAGLFRRRR